MTTSYKSSMAVADDVPSFVTTLNVYVRGKPLMAIVLIAEDIHEALRMGVSLMHMKYGLEKHATVRVSTMDESIEVLDSKGKIVVEIRLGEMHRTFRREESRFIYPMLGDK